MEERKFRGRRVVAEEYLQSTHELISYFTQQLALNKEEKEEEEIERKPTAASHETTAKRPSKTTTLPLFFLEEVSKKGIPERPHSILVYAKEHILSVSVSVCQYAYPPVKSIFSYLIYSPWF